MSCSVWLCLEITCFNTTWLLLVKISKIVTGSHGILFYPIFLKYLVWNEGYCTFMTSKHIPWLDNNQMVSLWYLCNRFQKLLGICYVEYHFIAKISYFCVFHHTKFLYILFHFQILLKYQISWILCFSIYPSIEVSNGFSMKN